MLDFLKKHWEGLLGTILGLAGIVIAIYTYEASKSEREPVFIIDRARTHILDSKSVANVPIKVERKDGTEIKSDLTAIRFYFWNNGKEPIEKKDILGNKPLAIISNDESVKILDHKLLKIANEDVTKIRLLDDPLSSRRLILDLDILQHNDGTTGQIIYEGNPGAIFTMSGTIKKVEKIKTDLYEEKVFWERLWLLIPSIILIISYVIFLIMESKFKSAPPKSRIFVLSILLLLSSFVLYKTFTYKPYTLKIGPAIISPD